MCQVVADKRLKTMEHHFKLSGPKSGRGRLQEVVPTVRLQQGKFWCFGLRQSLMGGGRLRERESTWRFDCALKV